MKRKTARAASLRLRMHVEEMKLIRLNAGVQGLSISNYRE
jgi:uncharacterized protein (DUF1778 family)